MSGSTIPEPPAQLKAIKGFMKVASEMERVDPIVAYWVRLYAAETALSIDRESAECKVFLKAVLYYLEQFKKTHQDNEAVTNQTVGQSHTENFVIALFNKVDTLDRDGVATNSTVRMFYTASILLEALAVFGALNEEMAKKAKYAKIKAAYVAKCLKAGITPKPGPIEDSDLVVGAGEQPNDSAVGPPPLPTSWTDNTVPPQNEPKKDGSKSTNPEPYIMTPSQHPSQPSLPSSEKPNSSYGSDKLPTIPQQQTPMSTIDPCSNSTPSASTISATKFHAINGSPLSPEDLIQGQKYCKFANSALQYDDIPTAVTNLEKALKLLTIGQKNN